MSTPIAYPYSLDFLASLRGCTLDAAGTLRFANGNVVRCYVDASQRWGLTYDPSEGAAIDAATLRTMQANPHTQPLFFMLGFDGSGNKVATVAIGVDGGPPDPGYTP